VIWILLFIIASLVWGSFLNVCAFRLVHELPDHFRTSSRSRCPHCHTQLAWYDLIPVISWLSLKGTCRYCNASISPLYPAIELLTLLLLSLMILRTPYQYWAAYGLFFSALIITIRTDIETLLISRYVTLMLLPIGIIGSFFNLLPLSLNDSILGAFFGFALLYLIAHIFYRLTERQGLGEGDFDLLAFIGAFTGVSGVWISLVIGSIIGSLIGLLLALISRHTKTDRKIPFGPFLAFGAICYILYSESLNTLLLGGA
jgi:leader peptidase (prepilin peptidase) / N-methyltransferase